MRPMPCVRWVIECPQMMARRRRDRRGSSPRQDPGGQQMGAEARQEDFTLQAEVCPHVPVWKPDTQNIGM